MDFVVINVLIPYSFKGTATLAVTPIKKMLSPMLNELQNKLQQGWLDWLSPKIIG